MDIIIYVLILILVKIILTTFVFRFQRTTLSISRKVLGVGNANFQSILTPNWIGILGWADTGLSILLIGLIFIKFGWLWALLAIAFIIFGATIIDVISPIPSYKLCFNLIKRSLKNDITKEDENNEKLEQVLDLVINIEKEYL